MVISPNGVKTELAKGTNISVVYHSVGSEVVAINSVTMANKVGHEKLIIQYVSINKKQLTRSG